MTYRHELKKTMLLLPSIKASTEEHSSKGRDVLSYFVQSGDLGQIFHRVCLVLIAVRGHECLGWKMSDS